MTENQKLTVELMEEAGYESAMKGLSLSYYKGDISVHEHFTQRFERMERLTPELNRKAIDECNKAHSKVLRQVHVWFLIRMPRNFWSQFDTYKVGTVAQSASTMHTLNKRLQTADDFTDNTKPEVISLLNSLIESGAGIEEIKDNLPEGFLQYRVVDFNYEIIQNIVTQRKKHRLKGAWLHFIYEIKKQIAHPELIIW